MEQKKKINYYRSFFEVSKNLNDKQFRKINMAIFEVMFFEKNIDSVVFSDNLLNIIWVSIKHSIDSSIKGYVNKLGIDYDDILPLGKGVSKGVSNNGKEKGKEKGKGKGKDNTYMPFSKIFEHYLSKKNLISHHRLTEEMKTAMKVAQKKSGLKEEDFLTIINRHSSIVEKTKDSEFPVKARSISELFGQKAYRATHLICSEYLDDGVKWLKYGIEKPKQRIENGIFIDDEYDMPNNW